VYAFIGNGRSIGIGMFRTDDCNGGVRRAAEEHVEAINVS